jgi:erythromycin esterase-like protein
LDLYSLYASIRAVLDFLDRADRVAARQARNRYACFDNFGYDMQAYGYTTSVGLSRSCQQEALNQWMEMQRRSVEIAKRDGHVARDAIFFAEQNARLVKNAEQYYRSMFRERISSWNLRDSHMVETLDALVRHLGPQTKVVMRSSLFLRTARMIFVTPTVRESCHGTVMALTIQGGVTE